MTEIEAKNLSAALRGEVLQPGDKGYDEARSIWNARFDRRPDLIVRCRRVEDVQAAVGFARSKDLRLSVKGGGHSFAANTVADGGLLIDLSPMKGIEINPVAKTARIEAGVKWGEFDPLAQEHGLASPGGTVSTVGVAGYTLGGGMGYLARNHGLAIDNLLAVDIVTADGTLLLASNEKNPDLFWALRGGGGNFGVATAFEFRLHEVGPDVLAGQIFHPFEAAPDLLRFYRDFMAEAPEEIQVYPFFLRVPPIELFPEEFHGQLALDFVVFHADTGSEAEAALRPLIEAGDPFLSAVGTQPYVSVLKTFDAGVPQGQRYESRAHHLPTLTDQAIDSMIEHLGQMVGSFTSAYLGCQDGAAVRVDPTATAFPHRDASYAFHIMAGWADADQDEEVTRWVRQTHDAMAPFSSADVYVNVLGSGEEDRIRAAYGQNYDRLVELKRKWDPDNLFRENHNIRPATD
jgi:FAD/FMN-containing dehydrogenase